MQSGWKGPPLHPGGGGDYCRIDVSMCLFPFLVEALGTSRLIIVTDESVSLPPSFHQRPPSPPLHPTPFALIYIYIYRERERERTRTRTRKLYFPRIVVEVHLDLSNN